MELRTTRLLLRPFREDDLDRLADWQSRSEVARFLYWEPRSREEAAEGLAKRLGETKLEQDDDVLALAVERREDGLLLGDTSIWLRSVEHRQVEIGYVFHPDAGGHGYATEAARALIDFAFKDLNAHRVYARTDARNTASAALLRRLGLREEAHFREAEIFKGAWGGELVFAILDREWQPGPSPTP
ncbi:MAG TPA: GNAT family N-acetyltransferase [Solirubrobacterales bacterium]|jgi:RimJ/RimL family protein N-acetyltransferase